MVATGITDEPSTARWMVETILADTSHAGWGEVRRVPVPGEIPSEAELNQWPTPARCTCAGGRLAGAPGTRYSPPGRPGSRPRSRDRAGVTGPCQALGPLRAAGHQPARVLDHRVDDRLRLTAASGPGYLVGALPGQRGEDGRVHPADRHVGQVQERVALPDPLPAPAAPHDLEPGRGIPGGEEQGQVAPLPAAVQDGVRPGLEEQGRVGRAARRAPRHPGPVLRLRLDRMALDSAAVRLRG